MSTWKENEEVVFKECVRVYGKEHVLHNVHIPSLSTPNRTRQVDILVKDIEVDGILTCIMVDAKAYQRKVDIKHVESMIGMLKDTGIEHGLIVSENGFSESAVNRAHLIEENFEVDILSLNELAKSQISDIAIPIDSLSFIFSKAPFGWIQTPYCNHDILMLLYPRGITFEYSAGQNKEFIYFQYYFKTKSINNVEDLIKEQNSLLMLDHPDAHIQLYAENGMYVRYFYHESYPTTEVTAFVEFDMMIIFGVLYSPDNILRKNVRKLKYLLNNTVPVVEASFEEPIRRYYIGNIDSKDLILNI